MLHSKIFPGERNTFIDRYIKERKHVPDAFYELSGNIVLKQKSSIEKGRRRTLSYEADNFQRINQIPGPNAFTPNLD